MDVTDEVEVPQCRPVLLVVDAQLLLQNDEIERLLYDEDEREHEVDFDGYVDETDERE